MVIRIWTDFPQFGLVFIIWTNILILDQFSRFGLILWNLDSFMAWGLVAMNELIGTLEEGSMIELDGQIENTKEGKAYQVEQANRIAQERRVISS